MLSKKVSNLQNNSCEVSSTKNSTNPIVKKTSTPPPKLVNCTGPVSCSINTPKIILNILSSHPSTSNASQIKVVVKPKKVKYLESSQQVLSKHNMTTICSFVFQYLSVTDLNQCRLVCKSWNLVASQKQFWQYIDLPISSIVQWGNFFDVLKQQQTKQLIIRSNIVSNFDSNHDLFLNMSIPKCESLQVIQLFYCPLILVINLLKTNRQLKKVHLKILQSDSVNLQNITELLDCENLRISSAKPTVVLKEPISFQNLIYLSTLSLRHITNLPKNLFESLSYCGCLQVLELGQCTNIPNNFGSTVLSTLFDLRQFRMEECNDFSSLTDIIHAISQLPNMTQLELINIQIDPEFANLISTCINLKKLLILPKYISKSASTNSSILMGIKSLHSTLSHFVWGITEELLHVTQIFWEQSSGAQCNTRLNAIPISIPTHCYGLIDQPLVKSNSIIPVTVIPTKSVTIKILPVASLFNVLNNTLPFTHIKVVFVPQYKTTDVRISSKPQY